MYWVLDLDFETVLVSLEAAFSLRNFSVSVFLNGNFCLDLISEASVSLVGFSVEDRQDM